MTDLFVDSVSGAVISAADWNQNWDLVQDSLSDLGPYVISGLTLSAGAGLAVTVAAGVASIGGRITASGSFSIAGLTDATTNHLFMRDDGTGTSNTTGTQPADTVKLGTAVTSGGVVTSTNILRDSGRQAKVRTESLVPGGPAAGNPGSINLAAWAAAAANSVTVYGTLPAGAMPAIAFDDLSDVTLTSQARGDIVYRNASVWVNLAAGTSGQFLKTQGAGANPIWATIPTGTPAIATKTANYTLLTTDAIILGDATSGSLTLTLPAVSGNTGLVYRIKKIDASGNTVTIDANASEQIDGALTAVLSIPFSSIDLACNGSAWYLL